MSAHPDSCQMNRPRLPRRQMHGMTQKIVRACHRLSLGRPHRSSHRNFFRRTSPERHALLRRVSTALMKCELLIAFSSWAATAPGVWRVAVRPGVFAGQTFFFTLLHPDYVGTSN